jgi:hypothetical protein
MLGKKSSLTRIRRGPVAKLLSWIHRRILRCSGLRIHDRLGNNYGVDRRCIRIYLLIDDDWLIGGAPATPSPAAPVARPTVVIPVVVVFVLVLVVARVFVFVVAGMFMLMTAAAVAVSAVSEGK